MPIALVAVAAVGVGLSVYQTVDAKKKQKEAEQAAQDYQRQQLKNPYENLQVSTMGAELQQQNLNNQVSTATDVLRAGGSRAVLGGLPTIYDSVIQSNAQIAAGLDQQYNQNQQMAAQGNAMVQNLNEQRQRDDLLGIGNAINTARQEYNQGLSNTVKSVYNLANAASTIPKSTNSVGGNNNFSNINFNTTSLNQPTQQVQPQNAIQSNLYNQQQIDQYNSYLYGNRRRMF